MIKKEIISVGVISQECKVILPIFFKSVISIINEAMVSMSTNSEISFKSL